MKREIIWALFSIPAIFYAFKISATFGFILMILVILGSYFNIKDAHDREENISERQNSFNYTEKWLEGFTTSQKYVSNDLTTSIMLDEANKKLCIVYSKPADKLMLNYKDILESEIIEDGHTITKTSRSSQFGGALLGGMIFGETGAIIGGLSAQTKSEKEVTRVDLKVVVNNTSKPVHIINFLSEVSLETGNKVAIKKDDPKYKEAINTVNHWHGLISVLIRQADEMDRIEQEKKKDHMSSISVVDELKKLSDLFKDGALTEQEYKELKEHLIHKK
ncbi:SHOCT domain-containing protein [Paenibacillus alvei]|uniref:SHOCT domain-containing protein n=1 Tax=Paenibacillus alvei TaxID=44250 RepID=UPI00227F9EF2|nr:SHOCT domain-containing protein [Paenibacillus alvei]